MNESQIMDKLEGIFRDVFDKPDLKLTKETTPGQIDEWDSLNTINLTVAIEDEFQIKVAVSEQKELKSVQSIVELIKRKIG